MYYYIKYFNPNEDRNVVEKYFCDKIIPHIKSNGYNVNLCKSSYGLSSEEYCLIVEMEGLKSMETFYHIFENDDCEHLSTFVDKFTRDSSVCVLEDIENDKWSIKTDKFYHIEGFNLLVDKAKFERFFLEEAFEHLRDTGFYIKVLKPILGKSTSEYLFITEFNKFGDLDNWANRTSSNKEVKCIMEKLVSYVDIPRAKVMYCII